MGNQVELTIDSRSSNVGLARVTVATFASQLNFTLAEIEEIKVAISEAVSNAIIHAYQDQVGKVKIKLGICEGQLEIIIKDKGQGIEDVEQACQSSYTTTDRMGLGLAFIESFMDKFELKSKLGTGTELRMVKVPSQEKKQVN
ncbi:anti-sigma F factor [Natroniella sp. ANB-PHB2]|uniref:anti-sigma F factor n=1 Tax=Natroniella sp. ANB-PHB2 TaxID=3384444 RepID=UPI0038D3B260